MKKFCANEVYFMIWYGDEEKLLPFIDSLVFIGKNLEEEDQSRDAWYFQDTESYSQSGAYPNDRPGDGRIYKLREEDLYQVVDGAELAIEITEWYVRRQEARQSGRST